MLSFIAVVSLPFLSLSISTACNRINLAFSSPSFFSDSLRELADFTIEFILSLYALDAVLNPLTRSDSSEVRINLLVYAIFSPCFSFSCYGTLKVFSRTPEPPVLVSFRTVPLFRVYSMFHQDYLLMQLQT